jgi:hypothetical protein
MLNVFLFIYIFIFLDWEVQLTLSVQSVMTLLVVSCCEIATMLVLGERAFGLVSLFIFEIHSLS